MDLWLLDCFVENPPIPFHFSGGPRCIGCPKSTLSHKIRQLEDEFGIELFVREGISCMSDRRRSEFLRHARLIQSNCEDAATAMAEMRQEVAGTLRVGSTGEFGTTITSELLYAFRQQFRRSISTSFFCSSGNCSPRGHRAGARRHLSLGRTIDVDYIVAGSRLILRSRCEPRIHRRARRHR